MPAGTRTERLDLFGAVRETDPLSNKIVGGRPSPAPNSVPISQNFASSNARDFKGFPLRGHELVPLTAICDAFRREMAL